MLWEVQATFCIGLFLNPHATRGKIVCIERLCKPLSFVSLSSLLCTNVCMKNTLVGSGHRLRVEMGPEQSGEWVAPADCTCAVRQVNAATIPLPVPGAQAPGPDVKKPAWVWLDQWKHAQGTGVALQPATGGKHFNRGSTAP